VIPDSFSDIFTRKVLIDSSNRIQKVIHHTPVLTCSHFNQVCGGELHFKCENFQKIGAFKMRGASNAILKLPSEKQKLGVATHSSGNHAQAVALAAKMAGIPAYIIMPENAPQVKIDAVKEYGAKVYFCKPTLEAREASLEHVVDQTGAIFIPPYDHPDIIAGQATASMELLKEVPDLDLIIAPIGGGGLLAGAALAAYFFSEKCKVYGAEPAGADDAYRSFQNKKLEPSIGPKTMADGLLTSVGKMNFSIISKLVEDILLVEEKEIANAMKNIMERMKLMVEPSAAVPLAAVLKNNVLFKNKKTGIILSGGNIDLFRIHELLQILK